MSNLENIAEKIKQNAQQEASAIEEKFKAESAELVAKSKSEALDKGTKLVERTKRYVEQNKKRMVSSAELIKRDTLLMAKQELLDKCFDKAKVMLENLDDEAYLDFVRRNIESFEDKADAQIIVPKKRLDLVKKAKLGGEVVADEELESGFLFKKSGVIYNFGFNDLVDFNREQLEGNMLTVLFGSGH